MHMFTILMGGKRVAPDIEFVSPRLPVAGDVYVFNVPVLSFAGVLYEPGDQLKIIERTTEQPHGRLNTLGNLRVRCKALTSVWTNIELMLDDGVIRLVERRITEEEMA